MPPAVQVQIVPTVVMVFGRTRFATSQSATGAMTRRYPLTMALHKAFIRATVTGPGQAVDGETGQRRPRIWPGSGIALES
jgi:hypothetical protein